MVTVTVASAANTAYILGHGLTVAADYRISPYSTITAQFPDTQAREIDSVSGLDFQEKAAIRSMLPLRSFALKIESIEGGKDLATKTWNSMWHFHLLSLSCGFPAIPLFSFSSTSEDVVLSVTNRHLFFHPLKEIKEVKKSQCQWASEKFDNFWNLIDEPKFASAMRYFGNSHYLPDLESRIMLLWSGVECLFNLDTEQSRRVALYAAMLHDRDKSEKIEYAERVRKAYHARSRIVHGSLLNQEKKEKAYDDASEILVRILSKCVALGRVPDRKEYDEIASSQSV